MYKKYSVQQKAQTMMILGLFLSVSACKIVQTENGEIKTTNSTKTTVVETDIVAKEPVSSGSTDPVNHHDHGNDVHDDGVPVEYVEEGPIEFKYLKINNQLVKIDLNSINNVGMNGKNSNVTLTNKNEKVESVEFEYGPNGIDTMHNSITLILRSLSGDQSLHINFYSYQYMEHGHDAFFDQNISINYDDYKNGYFASTHNNTLDGMEEFIAIKAGKFSVRILPLLKYLEANQHSNYKHQKIDPNFPQDYNIVDQLFSDDLFSLRISMGNNINYQGQTMWALNNCIYSSNDSAPADIDDICKAYLVLN